LESIESSNSAAEIPVSAAETKTNGHASTSAFELNADTAAGDLRDAIWQVLRDYAVLTKIDEKRQKNLALGIFDVCRDATRQTRNAAIAYGFPMMAFVVESTTVDTKGCKAKIAFPGGISRENRRLVIESVGGEVLMIPVPLDAMLRARGEVQIDKDQPDLPIEDGAGEAIGPLPGEAGAEGIDSKVNGAGDEPERATLGERIARLAVEGAQLAEDMADMPARKIGWQDGYEFVRDHADRWPQGVPGNADYELGHKEGYDERKALLAKATAEGAAAGDAGADRAVNPYQAGSKENEAWLIAWTGARPSETEAAPPVRDPSDEHLPPPKRGRGRPRRAQGEAAQP